MIEKIDMQQFDELIKGETPVVCDFYADWCGPCKMLGPVLESVSDLYSDKAEFVKVNIDENMELARRYNIMSIPFVAVFKKGEMVNKSVGYMDKNESVEFVKASL